MTSVLLTTGTPIIAATKSPTGGWLVPGSFTAVDMARILLIKKASGSARPFAFTPVQVSIPSEPTPDYYPAS